MSSIFIGWSGNKNLADEVARLINDANVDFAIVGGGQPKDMFIGAQVIDQINRCDIAILLIEDKNGIISPNLMFEWGYISAKYMVGNIYAFLINKQSKELPSDLMGSWVYEIQYDRESKSVEACAKEIFKLYDKNSKNFSVKNYFDLINDWKRTYVYLTDDIPDSNQALCEYILSGCLAAYYYQDNMLLRQTLNNLKVSSTINDVVFFAKSYIDVFIKSENMTKPLSQQDFFNGMQTFETMIARQKKLSDDVEMLLDILNFDVYGLSCVLFARNENLDEDTKKFCFEKAKKCFEEDIERLSMFESKFQNNLCLCQMLKSYIYNDFGHLCRDALNDKQKFLELLAASVEERKHLYQTFVSSYPGNTFLATKLEQEYIIALSEQCNYMQDSILKSMYKNTVIAKYEEWEKELVYTSSLTDRIRNNMKKF